ncbi:Qat anti-phage system QueC-like protein QatC [Pseudomonas sp. TE3610]
MRHHSIICRLGADDIDPIEIQHPGSHETAISFLDDYQRLNFGIGQAIDQLSNKGMRPSETAIDLALVAGALTAADTRISRKTESQNAWTREIDLYVPVADPGLWTSVSALLASTLHFLTGDRWRVFFRDRPHGLEELAPIVELFRSANPTSVCLFSGGMDSFIGAIDLLARGESPLLVSHYWDSNSTSKYQDQCLEALQERYPESAIHQIQARVGFPQGLVANIKGEDTLRGRSFLFFALAALAADATGTEMVIHVPENGLISLNVPLDPLRLGALSTRTTHPYYMARVNELFAGVGLRMRLHNMYSHRTKGQMAEQCADGAFLRANVHKTMSCSSPGKARYQRDPTNRQPKHCGFCVPCIIRRAAIAHGCGDDTTPYVIPDLHAHILNTNKADGAHVRSFQMAIRRLERAPHSARFDIHIPGPLIDHPDDLQAYEQVYVDGLDEVDRYLTGVRAQPL